MREYEINVAQSRQAYGQLTWLVRLIQNWRMRKTLKHMRHFSDYQLRDIGLMRDEVERLIALPLDCDHVAEAERCRLAASQFYANPKAILALPETGRAALAPLEQPARNLGGVINISLAKKFDEVSLFRAKDC